MTVKELIEKLKHMDQDLKVVTAGFDECDIDDIETVRLVNIAFDYQKETGHCGRHKEDPGAEPAVLIDF